MLFFGTHVINEQEVAYIDLWWTNTTAKVGYFDGESKVLDETATEEARTWFETVRRHDYLELEIGMIELERRKEFLLKPRNSRRAADKV